MIYAVFESYETAFAQWKRGVLSDADWEKWKVIISNYMAQPGVQQAWLNRGLKDALNHEFRGYVEQTGVGEGWQWLKEPPSDT